MQQADTTILLVDESRFFLTIEKQFLRNVPVTVLEAQTAAQAFTLSRKTPPHLIYLSYDLPDQRGDECCRQLKSDPQLRKIPIVMICDDRQGEQAELSRQAGCDAVLTKPLDRHRFLEIGRSFLAGIRERRRTCLIRVQAHAGDREFDGNALDISTGGLFLETAEVLTTGTELLLNIHLTRTQENGPWIQCSGIVAWINTIENPMKPNHPVGYGIRLTDVPLQHLGVMNGFIRSMEK